MAEIKLKGLESQGLSSPTDFVFGYQHSDSSNKKYKTEEDLNVKDSSSSANPNDNDSSDLVDSFDSEAEKVFVSPRMN